jgi:hypothetical protein
MGAPSEISTATCRRWPDFDVDGRDRRVERPGPGPALWLLCQCTLRSCGRAARHSSWAGLCRCALAIWRSIGQDSGRVLTASGTLGEYFRVTGGDPGHGVISQIDHHGPQALLTYTSATPASSLRASPTRTSDHRWPC